MKYKFDKHWEKEDNEDERASKEVKNIVERFKEMFTNADHHERQLIEKTIWDEYNSISSVDSHSYLLNYNAG